MVVVMVLLNNPPDMAALPTAEVAKREDLTLTLEASLEERRAADLIMVVVAVTALPNRAPDTAIKPLCHKSFNNIATTLYAQHTHTAQHTS